jgi:hypothetical protein
MSSTTSGAPGLVDGLLAAAITAIADDEVMIVPGYPWPQDAQDIVSVGQVVTADQEPASYGQRTRKENLTCDVTVSVFRPGGSEVQAAVTARAYVLLGRIERYTRVTDTTLGGAVEFCFMTSHELRTSSVPDTSSGRVTEITATFTAYARVTG